MAFKDQNGSVSYLLQHSFIPCPFFPKTTSIFFKYLFPHLAKYYRGSQLQPLFLRWPDWSKGDLISFARSGLGMGMWVNSDQYDKRGSLLKGIETGARKSFFHPKWKLQERRSLALPWTLSCLCDPQNCCSHIAISLRMEPTVKVV